MKTIIFDFGNVVGFFDHYRALRPLAEHTDLSCEEMYRAVIATDLEDAYEAGRISTGQFLAKVHQLWKARCRPEELGKSLADIFWPNEEVCSLIPALKGRYRLLLGSNTNELHTCQFRRQFDDQLKHFDHLVLSYEIGVRKPKAAFFEHCLERADCTASECLFIDDMPANVAAAQACGLHGLVYRQGGNLRRRLAEMEVVLDNSEPVWATGLPAVSYNK